MTRYEKGLEQFVAAAQSFACSAIALLAVTPDDDSDAYTELAGVAVARARFALLEALNAAPNLKSVFVVPPMPALPDTSAAIPDLALPA